MPSDSDFVAVHEVIDEAEKRVWQQTGVYVVIHMEMCIRDRNSSTGDAQTRVPFPLLTRENVSRGYFLRVWLHPAGAYAKI